MKPKIISGVLLPALCAAILLLGGCTGSSQGTSSTDTAGGVSGSSAADGSETSTDISLFTGKWEALNNDGSVKTKLEIKTDGTATYTIPMADVGFYNATWKANDKGGLDISRDDGVESWCRVKAGILTEGVEIGGTITLTNYSRVS